MKAKIAIRALVALVAVGIIAPESVSTPDDWKYKSGEGFKELRKGNWEAAVAALTAANEKLRADMAAHGTEDSMAAKQLLQYLGMAHLKYAQQCLGGGRLAVGDSNARTAVDIFTNLYWVPRGDLSVVYSVLGVAKDSLGQHEVALPIHRKSLMYIEEKAGFFDPLCALYSLRMALSYESLARYYEAEPLFLTVCEVVDSAHKARVQLLGEQFFQEALIPIPEKRPKYKDWLHDLGTQARMGLVRIMALTDRSEGADSVLEATLVEMERWKKPFAIYVVDNAVSSQGVRLRAEGNSSQADSLAFRWAKLKSKPKP